MPSLVSEGVSEGVAVMQFEDIAVNNSWRTLYVKAFAIQPVAKEAFWRHIPELI
jgi:hypothetical protein